MRTAITLGYEHGSGRAVLVSGPDIPITQQRETLKAIAGKAHALFSQIEVWDSSGLTKWRRFEHPDAKPAPAVAPVESPTKTVALKGVKPAKSKADQG